MLLGFFLTSKVPQALVLLDVEGCSKDMGALVRLCIY